MNLFLAILSGLFLLAYLAIALVIARRPLIGRIAIREATARPAQTAVLVAGLMIAGASIYSAQVIFDSFYATSTANVLQSWGRDDVEISGGGATFDPALAQLLGSQSESCACIAALQNAVVTSGSVVDADHETGKSSVQITGLDMTAEQRFGQFVLTSGHSTLGDDLAAGEVWLSQPLADALGARAGDHLGVIAGGTASRDITVAGTVTSQGPGAYGQGQGPYGFDFSLFASLQTVQQLAGINGVNLIRVSARGDGDAEIANGQTAASVLRRLLAAQGANLQVLEGKRSALNIIFDQDQAGREYVTAFTVMIALAATALVANLAVMLAEERRPRLAVLRALGLTRSGLVQLAVTEGGAYSLLAAIAGIPAGFAFGFLLIHGPGSPTTHFSVRPESIIGSVAAAALINLVTVSLAAVRTSRMAISSAIRDLPDPAPLRRLTRRRLAVLGLVGVAGLAAMFAGFPFLFLVGGALLIAAAAGFSLGRVTDRARYSAAAAAASAWAIVDLKFGPQPPATGNELAGGPELLAAAVIVAVVSLSILMAANLGLLEVGIGVLGRTSALVSATLRPSTAYSARRPLRSGLVIAAFAIVMAVLVWVQTVTSTHEADYRTFTGGWDVQAIATGTDQLSVPDSLQHEVATQEEFPSRTYFGPVKWVYADATGTIDWHQEQVTVFGLSDRQLDTGLGFNDPKSWAAIAGNPGLMAAAASVGTVVYLATDHGPISFQVAVTIPASGQFGNSTIVPGLIVSKAGLDRLGASAPGAMMLLKAAPGTSPDTLARDLQRATRSAGSAVNTTNGLVNADFTSGGGGQAGFEILLMRVGLLVGITSLGAVALRAVIERRRSIGLLRAIGYQPGQVLVGLLTETVLVATAGVAVGAAAGYSIGEVVISLFGYVSRGTLDLGSLALTTALVYATVLLVTILPARRAARLRPAEALRVLS